MSLAKDDHLIKAGQYCDHYYFVEAGSLRIYTMVDHLVVTNWFAFQGNFFTELESYTYQSQAKFNIQAIEHCSLLCISRHNMNKLLQQYPAWSELVCKTWEQAFLRLTQIVLNVQTISAKGRYEHLYNNNNGHVPKPPLVNNGTLVEIPDSSLSKK